MYQSVTKFMIYVQQCIQSTTPLLCRISVTLISRLLLCYTMLQTIHLPSAKSFLRYTVHCVSSSAEHWSAALRSAGAPERSRFAGARSERRSRKLARSAVGAPLRKKAGAHLERWRSDCAPANSEIHQIHYKKFRAARSFFDFNTYEKLDCYTILVCLLILRKFNSPNAYPIGLLAGSWIGDTSFK